MMAATVTLGFQRVVMRELSGQRCVASLAGKALPNQS
jgi:hypothetical protein